MAEILTSFFEAIFVCQLYLLQLSLAPRHLRNNHLTSLLQGNRQKAKRATPFKSSFFLPETSASVIPTLSPKLRGKATFGATVSPQIHPCNSNLARHVTNWTQRPARKGKGDVRRSYEPYERQDGRDFYRVFCLPALPFATLHGAFYQVLQSWASQSPG